MPLKLKIISIGKTKETWLEEALLEYHKRLKHSVTIEYVFAKDDAHLIDLVEKEPSLICLDASGSMMDSEEFSKFLISKFELGKTRLAVVIGGAEGLPLQLKKKPLISFSRMTFTHQMIRLILIEQVYRAFEIAKGTKYHK